MLNLMKLEWRKNQLTSYLKYVVGSIFVIFLLTSLMAIGANSQEEVMFVDFASFMSLVTIFIRLVFVIFSGILLSRLIVDEYKNNTIQVLFSYPIKRAKMMKSKLLLVWAYCFFSLLVATICIDSLIFIVNPILDLFPEKVTLAMIIRTLPPTVIEAFMTACLSLIPLYFGLRKKSTATTITLAVLIGFLVNGTVSDDSAQVNLSQIIVIPALLSLLGLMVGYLSYHNIETKDVG
ncbi:bacitracin ABC transporter permease [Enterococcus sp. JM4C]|uniref:ABC transporter permease n=1 Tax=Candidatus Enterococcus huntleyi TaxID=1857217 RepID=UPI00137A4C81|nr:ABC transporter permease [Enterococcus sp. JM4C]KAF1295085.1 bacitracin ABC transporter permease [Enterococcus sp. JM4C]